MTDTIAIQSNPVSRFVSSAARTIGRSEIAILALALIICLCANIALNSVGVTIDWGRAIFLNSRFVTLILIVFIAVEFALLLVRYRPSSPVGFFLKDPRAHPAYARILPAFCMVVAVGTLMPAFSYIKGAIPLLSEYTWDQTFIDWDAAIHGTDPWRLLQPFLGYPEVSAALGHLYHLWFALIYIGPLCFALYVTDKQLRLRFFLGYFLTWTIVGMVGAISLASVGPVFLEPLLGDDHFAEQMAYLHAANAVQTIPVIEVQQMLLDWYAAGDYGLGRGITAMPSMHVALTSLYVFATWKIDKRLWAAFAVFWLLIMLGSVHLAYHYAVDGYVALAMVAVIWAATKPAAGFILNIGKSPETSAAT